MRSPLVATLFIALSSVCFGLVPLFARMLLDEGLSTEAIALYRFCLALPLALAFLPRRRTAWRPVAALAGGGIASGLGWTTYLTAIDHATVASVGVVYMSYPLFVVLLAWLLLGQRLTPRALAGAALVVAGAFTVNAPGTVSAGELLVLAASLPAPVGFALMVLLIVTVGQDLTNLERWSVICVGHVIGLLPAALLDDPAGLVPASRDGWLWLAGLAGVTATIPQLLYTFWARQVSPARAAATGAVELPTMLVVGWLAFGEALGAAELVGASMVVAAIIVTPAMAPRRAAAPARLPARAGA